MISKKLLLAGVAGLVLAGYGVLRFYSQELAPRSKCRKHLRGIALTVATERHLHDGRFPLDLMSIDQGLLRKVLICPGNRRLPAKDFSQIDYIYLNWSEAPTKTNLDVSKLPLAYDRTMKNHSDSGINVVLVDGTVFWDRGASWLKNFAKEHPEPRIPMPE